eukprot:CAMPEP_0206432604 /NCGR_PEP_ID=MMETSP0324_2-20121206/8058_1 /ASSEMBLY_ACC=CAM_ASM_000836 /TAXON_ID=2866 /ORGANISM="Crypthecodinium cohnii, Strain Seligo" /LENGTH=301 /DNA_ID=CAMNT_0053898753 /DNA_START=20 /DNA_END=925 /DNA_ORIENTATION=+
MGATCCAMPLEQVNFGANAEKAERLDSVRMMDAELILPVEVPSQHHHKLTCEDLAVGSKSTRGSDKYNMIPTETRDTDSAETDTESVVSCNTMASTVFPGQRRDQEEPSASTESLPKAAQALQMLSQIVSFPEFEDPRNFEPTILGDSLVLADLEIAERLAGGQWAYPDCEVVAVVAAMRGVSAMEKEYASLPTPISFLSVECSDRQPILGEPPNFERARSVAAFVAAHHSASPGKRGRVLLHCEDGLEHGACLAVAVLMLRQRMRLREAVEMVRNSRPAILQDASLRRQLVLLAGQEGLL